MARAIETKNAELILLLTADEVRALTLMLDRDPPTLPDELQDLHDLLTWDEP